MTGRRAKNVRNGLCFPGVYLTNSANWMTKNMAPNFRIRQAANFLTNEGRGNSKDD